MIPARPTARNPLLDEHRRRSGVANPDEVEAIRRRWGFAIPDDTALDTLAAFAQPSGIIEIGAGLGYWAQLLTTRGVDVIAFDLHPPPSPANAWFAGIDPYHPIGEADADIAARHPDRTLLVIWPAKNQEWAATAAAGFHSAGGHRLAYVGTSPGGRTADDQFHAQLGNHAVCVACAYGVVSVPCICATPVLWQHVATHRLPHWPTDEDDLHLYRRAPTRPRRRDSQSRFRTRLRRKQPGVPHRSGTS